MAVWSAFCALTAAATGFVSLLVIRVFFGVGEGPLSSTMNKVVNNWFPHREAASAVGYANCGTPLGGAIAGPIVGLMAVAFGWRVSFVASARSASSGSPSGSCSRPRRRASTRRSAPRSCARSRTTRPTRRAGLPTQPLGFYLRQPVVLATGLAFFGYNYILFFFLTWFPSYLTMAQHLSIKDMSIATVLPWVLGFCGLAPAAAVSDAVFRRTGRALFARKLVLTVCLSIAAVCVALAGPRHHRRQRAAR